VREAPGKRYRREEVRYVDVQGRVAWSGCGIDDMRVHIAHRENMNECKTLD
jgi:hypothetical protein